MWDSSGSGCVRYSADGAGEAAMGHVAENDVLQAALLHQLRRPGSSTELLWPVRLFAVCEQCVGSAVATGPVQCPFEHM